MSILWTIIIGFVAGVIAKLLHPGPNEPSGFVLTTILGIVGALVATYLGQAIGWYNAGEGAGLVGAVVGALIVLVVWGLSRAAPWRLNVPSRVAIREGILAVVVPIVRISRDDADVVRPSVGAGRRTGQRRDRLSCCPRRISKKKPRKRRTPEVAV